MLICQITDTHIKLPGKLAYRKVDTAAMLAACVSAVSKLDPRPDAIVMTGDLVDLGRPDEYAHLLSLLSPLALPIYAIPGNHDERDAMRAAFAKDGYFPKSGYLHYAIENWPLRLVGLDTLVPGKGEGELCSERIAWLDRKLSERSGTPTVVMMHHPPFPTGIEHMDKIGLRGADAFAAVMARHSQVVAILCGHLHRSIYAQVGGRRACTSPSPAHQVALDFRPGEPGGFRMEPPGYMLHRWTDGILVSHVAAIGEYAGPFPFFDSSGRLID